MILDNVDFIEMRGITSFIGHGYFHNNPAVSSDLIMQLRYGAPSGKEYGRPIEPSGPNSWIIADDDYKKPE